MYKCQENLRLSAPRWNLLSRLCFRLYSSGATVSDRPEPLFEGDNTLVLSFESDFVFQRFSRMLFQYEAGNSVCFITPDTSGTVITSHVVFNSTPKIDSLPEV